MYTIVLNQTNLINNGQNNVLVYNFPTSVDLTDKYVAVVSISMFYSWFNITSASQNNTISFTWDSAGATYTITIPDGLYEIADINGYLQWWFIQNGFYYIDAGGSYVYMAELIVNGSRYSIQLNTFYNYSAGTLPTGWTTPSNFAGYPTQRQNPVIVFNATFNNIVGYPAGFTSNANILNAYVPPTASASNNYVSKSTAGTISYLSNTAPQVQPNSNVLFALSNVNSPYSRPTGIVYSLNPNVRVGEQVYEVPPNFIWTKLINGFHSNITLTILGTDGKPLVINDPNMTILLSIRDKNENLT